jgi:glutamate--cysteine ligase catalytic subunit
MSHHGVLVENAAFTVFVVLLNRVILAFDLALYVPISRVDENMQRAQKRDAARTEKFFFRRFMAPPDEAELRAVDCSQGCFRSTNLSDPADRDTWLAEEDCYEEMTLNEIFNGKLNYFPGLVPLIYAYLEHIECDKDPEVFTRLDQYLQFVAGRARGDLITCATWQRNFIAAHPSYRQDSVVSSEVLYDLLMACKDIGEGNRACPEVYGNVVIDKYVH